MQQRRSITGCRFRDTVRWNWIYSVYAVGVENYLGKEVKGFKFREIF